MFFLTMRRPVLPRDQWTVTLDTHLVWMKEQHDKGNTMSGPNGERTLGIYLIKAESRDQAEKIAASDPYTVAGHTTFDLIDWQIHQILGIGPFTAAGLGLH